jgi:hypothetical protein
MSWLHRVVNGEILRSPATTSKWPRIWHLRCREQNIIPREKEKRIPTPTKIQSVSKVQTSPGQGVKQALVSIAAAAAETPFTGVANPASPFAESRLELSLLRVLPFPSSLLV